MKRLALLVVLAACSRHPRSSGGIDQLIDRDDTWTVRAELHEHTLTVILRDAQGIPISGARVEAGIDDRSLLFEAAPGRYRRVLTGVVPGAPQVTVRAFFQDVHYAGTIVAENTP